MLNHEFINFLEINQKEIEKKYNNENLKEMFSKLDDRVLKYIQPIVINDNIFFSTTIGTDRKFIKGLIITMFPILSRYGYELNLVRYDKKEVLKLIEV